MRIVFAAILVAVSSGAAASADEVFGNWMIFPGPNPEAADLLPDADPDTVFRIGQVIFEYSFDRLAKDHQPVKDLSQLQSVADVVKVAAPGPALAALVNQQLTIPHRFQFESATVVDYGDAGLIWNVTYELFPKVGGFSGMPFRYRAVVDGHGNLLLPRRIIFDAFFHSATEGWTCSLLQLPASPTAKDAVLAPRKIRSRATESLFNATQHSDAAHAVMKRMVYHGQKFVRIPVATDAMGELIHVDVWSVNFRDFSRKERSDELLTVWVTSDGRTAEIRHLDHCWEADERLFNREPVKRFPPPMRRPGLRKLLLLDAAESLDDLRVPPGNRLEKLRGNREGRHSIRINDRWRVCFRWEAGDAYEVEILDYH